MYTLIPRGADTSKAVDRFWRRRLLLFPVLLLVFGIGFAHHVEAGSTQFRLYASNAAPASSVFFMFSTDANTYQPGQTITVTLNINSDDNPQGNGCTNVYLSTNNGVSYTGNLAGCYPVSEFPMGLQYTYTVPAPSSPGSFNLSISTRLDGYGVPAVQSIPLTVAAPTAPTVSISANPISFTQGGSTTLSWTTTNATSCTASGDWSGSKTVPSGSQVVTPTSSGIFNYTLSCTGPGGSATNTVNVTVAPATYTITASAGTNGSISPSGSVSVTSGSNQTFTITPNSGYVISSVVVDGVSQGAIGTYTFSNVTANHTISASFLAPSSCVCTTGAACNYSGWECISQAYNSPQPPPPCSTIGNPLAPGAQCSIQGGGVCQATNATGDKYLIFSCPIVASYTITASAGTNGSISPSGAVSVTSGSNQTFTITPNSGYSISSMVVDGVSQPIRTTYTFSNVTANHTISASFTQAPCVCTTGVSCSPSGFACVAHGTTPPPPPPPCSTTGNPLASGRQCSVPEGGTCGTNDTGDFYLLYSCPAFTITANSVAPITLPTTSFTETYTLTGGTSSNTSCELLDYTGSTVLVPYAPCSGSISYHTLSSAGTYGYYVRANQPSTGETVTSNEFTVTVNPAPSCSATTISNCSLPLTTSGNSAGSCTTGYIGSCSYTCSGTTWSKNSNSCALPASCSSKFSSWSSGCAATQSAEPSGYSSQLRNTVSGYTGAESASCTNGVWSFTSPVCSVIASVLNISASPTRVTSGSSSKISWSASNVRSCTVTGPSGTIASGPSDKNLNFNTGSPQLVPISTQSIFTITCTSMSGNSVSNTAIVDVGPVFQEF